MNFEISILKFLVKPTIWLSQFLDENYFVLVCKGYDDDWENFTGIYWQDDKENCLVYKDYKIWVSSNSNQICK